MTEEWTENYQDCLRAAGEGGGEELTIVLLLWLVVGLHDHLLKLLLRIRGHLNQRNAMGKGFFSCFCLRGVPSAEHSVAVETGH